MTGDEATMARLMRAAQAGDRQAYAVLLDQAAKWLRRYFRKRIALEKLDDLVQEVLLSVHAKRSTYDPARPFYPWLAAIARYRWVDQLRVEYRTQTQELLEDTASEESGEEPVMARVSLERLFDHLPPAQAEAIELVKIEGCSVAEASERTGQSPSLVKVNIHRGIRKLAAIIEKAS
ncbi:sigma-70 family RNA polymerase sigma factor [Novosphingobium album (ex Hu et al. 2023)]|uniref:Sigma-70 family RNA polymerase sigma factor n=1 Tax=Novosphingobium album (ex Hu et al. 2023) TaxID=2930093 RepID=A0ABT0B2V4_9SPHN|nr:sigma-70 family RNA polymerase sigma factor [Novosphingobium album (ex Hu et al. 2023)]MCJ2179144.1 sigma-70 family RNA polymerase sigma factor [Novosphingobium album (ex Hu et al. 2023)]